MRFRAWPSVAALSVTWVVLLALSACTSEPEMTPLQAGLVLYAEGVRQHTATVQLQHTPEDVYAGMVRAIERLPDVSITRRNDRHYFVEVIEGANSVAAQATLVGPNRTLLFVWATVGQGNETGRDLALRAVRAICAELGDRCTMKDL